MSLSLDNTHRLWGFRLGMAKSTQSVGIWPNLTRLDPKGRGFTRPVKQ